MTGPTTRPPSSPPPLPWPSDEPATAPADGCAPATSAATAAAATTAAVAAAERWQLLQLACSVTPRTLAERLSGVRIVQSTSATQPVAGHRQQQRRRQWATTATTTATIAALAVQSEEHDPRQTSPRSRRSAATAATVPATAATKTRAKATKALASAKSRTPASAVAVGAGAPDADADVGNAATAAVDMIASAQGASTGAMVTAAPCTVPTTPTSPASAVATSKASTATSVTRTAPSAPSATTTAIGLPHAPADAAPVSMPAVSAMLPNFSSLTAEEHALYLHLAARVGPDGVGVDHLADDERAVFERLRRRVSAEQRLYLGEMRLRALRRAACYAHVDAGVLAAARAAYAACRSRVATYRRFYRPLDTIVLTVASEPMAPTPWLRREAISLQLGPVADATAVVHAESTTAAATAAAVLVAPDFRRFRLPMRIPTTLLAPLPAAMPPSASASAGVDAAGSTTAAPTHVPSLRTRAVLAEMSADATVARLCDRYAVDLAVSGGALAALADTDPMHAGDWELPVHVHARNADADADGLGSSSHHTVVFVDKPLASRRPTARAVNTRYYRAALEQLFKVVVASAASSPAAGDPACVAVGAASSATCVAANGGGDSGSIVYSVWTFGDALRLLIRNRVRNSVADSSGVSPVRLRAPHFPFHVHNAPVAGGSHSALLFAACCSARWASLQRWSTCWTRASRRTRRASVRAGGSPATYVPQRALSLGVSIR